MRDEPGRARGQRVPVKLYTTDDRVMVAAPMPGLQPGDVSVEVTAGSRVVLHRELRGVLKAQVFDAWATNVRDGHLGVPAPDDSAPRAHWRETKEILLDEWDVDVYHGELDLPAAVDGSLGTATYGNGVLVVALPVSPQTRPARLRLETVGPSRGQRVGALGTRSSRSPRLSTALPRRRSAPGVDVPVGARRPAAVSSRTVDHNAPDCCDRARAAGVTSLITSPTDYFQIEPS
jgi:HSP20 family protein